MITKVTQYITNLSMIEAGDRVIVGLSGGADSVCLLFLLCQLRDQFSFSLEAVHINHKLRKEADDEELFVKDLCYRLQIPCKTISIDVQSFQEKEHLGTEEAARILRYEVFEKEIATGAKIALAHHQNDQAETVLFHLFRGSGLKGLRGMQPVRDAFIRPLLCVSREEIEAFLHDQEIDFVTDQSNFDTTYARNRIRHDILPVATKHICTTSVAHIGASAESVGLALDYLEEQTNVLWERHVQTTKNGCRIAKKELQLLHPYMQTELVYRMMEAAGGFKKDIGRVHADAVLGLLSAQSGKKLSLMYQTEAFTDQEYLIIERKAIAQSDCLELKDIVKSIDLTKLDDGQSVESTFGKVRMHFHIFEKDNSIDIVRENYTKWFDYDKIKTSLDIRCRRAGDYFYCTSDSKKKLKEYLINEKISVLSRDEIPLIAEGSHIIWIVGYRISEYYKVTDKTKRILEITIEEGE